MTDLDSILKNRDITLLTKVHLVKAMVFPIVMYRCESWTIKKAEHQRTDAFELWCWRRLLRVPWTARSSNQSTLKEISSKYSLEGLMLKLKLQYLGHLMRRTDSLEKTLMLESLKAEGGDDRGWDGLMASLTQWTEIWASSKSWWWTGKPGMLQSMGCKDSETTEQLNNNNTWMDLEVITVRKSKSERERKIPDDITYMWNLKCNPNMKQKQTHRHRRQTSGCQWSEGWEMDGLAAWD